MANINFVHQRIKKLTNLEKKDKKTFQIVTIITSVLILILTATLGYRLYLTSQLKDIEKSQNIFLSRIKKQEKRERSFVLFVNKLKVLSSIFQKRKNKQEAIDYFSQVFGPNVVIEKIVYDSDSDLLTFRLLAADIFTLDNVFDLLDKAKSNQNFSSLAKSNLQRTSKGTYQMQITVVMGEEKNEK